mmetsp:Transcript_77135/g.121817  ORF Transcript_77135/g.121817 Transcript_77135/m.121817 type:complete len:267 (+) Transcript_77135:127-927(+)
MGSQNACCCSEEESVLPASFDMVTPQQPKALFLKQFQGLTVDESESGLGRDQVETTILRSPKRGHGNPFRTRLLAATRQDDAPSVLQCVADGADVADMSEALRFAAQRGAVSVVRELVALGLSVNEGDAESGFAPLQLAAVTGHLSVCELLLDALADANKDIRGATALSMARQLGNVEVEEILLQHAASLAIANSPGAEDSQWQRRPHVLPRVSPLLSEAVLQASNEESPRKTSLDTASQIQTPHSAQQGMGQEAATVGRVHSGSM